MRKLGIIGGMSWLSTRTYYEHINRIVQQRKSPRHSAPLLIESIDFDRVYRLRDEEEWSRAADILSQSAQRLVDAGAEALIIAANSMHRIYSRVSQAVDVPIIHIAECVGERLAADEFESVALVGTRNVTTEGWYRRRLIAHGINLLPPDPANAEIIDAIIYDELMLGKTKRESQRALKTIFTNKEKDGAQAIVLACTELEMIVDVDANVLPIYDSTRIHAEAAANWILGSD